MSAPSRPASLPRRSTDAHKGNFGRVLLIGGSRGMSGSIALSATAALRTGSGLVSAAVPDRCLETVASFNPCVMTVPLPDDQEGRVSGESSGMVASQLKSMDAVGIGPGMGTGSGTQRLVEKVLQLDSTPRCLDADALNVLPDLDWPGPMQASGDEAPNLVLTPHPGELARLVDASPADREKQIDAAQGLAERGNCVVVVKGGPTVVVSANRRWENTTGNPGMATAGCGDVLTGMLTSLLGQGFSGWDAARLAVWIHGVAGDRAADRLGQAGLIATDVIDEIPAALQSAIAEAS